MIYKYTYKTPQQFSNIIMNSDGKFLIGLCFDGSKNLLKHEIDCKEENLPIFQETCKWLDIYFSGKIPNFMPKYKINNITPFRKEVIEIMNSIHYGKTLTYQNIAQIIANRRKIDKMSAQAVGGAVGWNPICIIIPCHRVVGANGNLTGYGGGINNKIELLKLEGVDMEKYYVPKRGNKL